MVFTVINNPSFQAQTGFTNAQFKKLDDLYCRCAALKTLSNRAVDCNFDEGVATYTYYKSGNNTPYLQFVIRKVGPSTLMYEIFKESKGRITKSGLFERAFEKLAEEMETLLNP